MKKIDRYFLLSLVKPFVGSALVLTMILLLNSIFQLMDLIVRKGVPMSMVLKVIFYTLPFVINMTFPMAFLVAGLIFFGRIAANNEILALKSGGIDLKKVFQKLSIFLVLFAIFNIVFNFWLLPATNYSLKKTLFTIRVTKPAIQIEVGVFNKIENFLIFAEAKDEKRGILKRVKIQEISRDGVKFIHADEGRIKTTREGDVLMELYNGEFVETRGEKKQEFRRGVFKKEIVVLRVNKEDFYGDLVYKGDREKTINELVKELKEAKREMAGYSKDDKISRDFTKRRINILLSEVHTRLALPFAALIFVLFSFPVAIKFKFSGYGSALGVSFFFFIIYYILLLLGQEVARRTSINAFLSIWFPNMFFGVITAIFMARELKK